MFTVIDLCFHIDTVPTIASRGQHSCAASAEGVQHSVSREGKHFYQTVGKLQGEGGRVTILCGGSWHFPYLAEPILKIFLWNLAVDALLFCRLSVSAGFSFHQDIFHIVFDDGVGLIGFS